MNPYYGTPNWRDRILETIAANNRGQPKFAGKLLENLAQHAAAFSPANVNPPIEKRTYILGIIDSHGAVHSVVIGTPGQIHEDFWPVTAQKRWRYAIWRNQLCLLADAQGRVEYELTAEDHEAIRAHLARKGYELITRE